MERVNKQANQSPYVKDAFHNYVIHRCAAAVNPQNVGSKAAAYYQLTIPAVKNQTVRLRLAETDPDSLQADRDGNPIGGSFDHFRGRSAWHPGPLASLSHRLKDNSETKILEIMKTAGFANAKKIGSGALFLGHLRFGYYSGSRNDATVNSQ